MAAHPRVIRLADDAYELLRREAERRGVDPDALAERLLRADLAATRGWDDLDQTLAVLADLRGRLPEIDGLELARQARADLEARSA